jgi:hypothetical protein
LTAFQEVGGRTDGPGNWAKGMIDNGKAIDIVLSADNNPYLFPRDK